MNTVSCYSGGSYAGRPLRFTWMDQEYQVTKILSSARRPQGKVFSVQTESGKTFSLEYNFPIDTWEVTPI
jgi:hypothetical protein